MCPKFINKFVVSKGFLFTYEQLSAILCDNQKLIVTAKDSNGRTLIGSFVETFNIYDLIKAENASQTYKTKIASWLMCYSKPSIPCDIKKDENVQFYFIHSHNYLQIKKPAEVKEDDYLICEMKGDAAFSFNSYCKFFVTREWYPS